MYTVWLYLWQALSWKPSIHVLAWWIRIGYIKVRVAGLKVLHIVKPGQSFHQWIRVTRSWYASLMGGNNSKSATRIEAATPRRWYFGPDTRWCLKAEADNHRYFCNTFFITATTPCMQTNKEIARPFVRMCDAAYMNSMQCICSFANLSRQTQYLVCVATAAKRRPLAWIRGESSAWSTGTLMPIPVRNKDPSEKTTLQPPTVW